MRLMLLSGETVNVAIRNGNEAVLIGQLGVNRWSGCVRRWAVVCRCMLPGRQGATLSAGGRRVDEHHSANRFAAVYANDACGYAHLAEGPEQARELGYTVDKEEHVVGLNCIASAIYDDVGSVVAAISISGLHQD